MRRSLANAAVGTAAAALAIVYGFMMTSSAWRWTTVNVIGCAVALVVVVTQIYVRASRRSASWPLRVALVLGCIVVVRQTLGPAGREAAYRIACLRAGNFCASVTLTEALAKAPGGLLPSAALYRALLERRALTCDSVTIARLRVIAASRAYTYATDAAIRRLVLCGRQLHNAALAVKPYSLGIPPSIQPTLFARAQWALGVACGMHDPPAAEYYARVMFRADARLFMALRPVTLRPAAPCALRALWLAGEQPASAASNALGVAPC